MNRLKQAVRDHFDEHGLVGGILLLPVMLWLGLVMFVAVLPVAIAYVAIPVFGVGLVVFALGAAIKQIIHHPRVTESIGLEVLIVGALAFGLFLLRAQIKDWKGEEYKASKPAIAMASCGLLAAIAGAVVFLSSVHISESKRSAGSFCSSHECIPNFDNGRGSIVQCADGEWSHSGGLQGACSDHGGERNESEE